MKKKIILAVSMILLCIISLFAVGKFRNSINEDNNKISKIEEKKEVNKEDKAKSDNKTQDAKKEEATTKETVSKNTTEEKQKNDVSKESNNIDTQNKNNSGNQQPNIQKDNNATPVSENKSKENVNSNNDKKVESKSNITIIDGINNKIIVSQKAEFNGEDVAKVTMRVLDEAGVKYKATTMADNTYFSSIAGLKERAEGPASGWCYFVNGEKPSLSSGAYKLKKDDVIEWKYLRDGIK